MASNCDPHEICEECPEWIFTLADLLMCMMGLFVILWVLKPDASAASSPEQATREQIRQEELIRDIQMAFGASPEDNAERQVRIEQLYKMLDQMKREGTGGAGHAETEAKGAEGTDSEVETIRDGDRAGVGGRVRFDSGVAALAEGDDVTIRQIAAKIRGFRNIVLVKGHTAPDDLPEDLDFGSDEARHFETELSLKRASIVADALIANGVSPEILRVQACGRWEPVRRRAYAAEDRRANRRVEVQATDQLVVARQAD